MYVKFLVVDINRHEGAHTLAEAINKGCREIHGKYLGHSSETGDQFTRIIIAYEPGLQFSAKPTAYAEPQD